MRAFFCVIINLMNKTTKKAVIGLAELHDQAYEDYKAGMKYKDIAKKYGVTINTVKSWKTRHWNKKGVHTKKEKSMHTKRKRGGQPGNKNATGPPKNQNARKHGLYSKWLPAETKEIFDEIPDDPIELLWINVKLQFTAILRAQNIMLVESKDDNTKEVSMISDEATAFDIQYSWDKQANFMNAQSRAMKTLEGLVRSYDELVHKNWDIATDIQKMRVEYIQAQIYKIKKVDDKNDDDGVTIIDDLPKGEYDEEAN